MRLAAVEQRHRVPASDRGVDDLRTEARRTAEHQDLQGLRGLRAREAARPRERGQPRARRHGPLHQLASRRPATWSPGGHVVPARRGIGAGSRRGRRALLALHHVGLGRAAAAELVADLDRVRAAHRRHERDRHDREALRHALRRRAEQRGRVRGRRGAIGAFVGSNTVSAGCSVEPWPDRKRWPSLPGGAAWSA